MMKVTKKSKMRMTKQMTKKRNNGPAKIGCTSLIALNSVSLAVEIKKKKMRKTKSIQRTQTPLRL